jgi:CPA1 family monovalent cation:H+ antiporter
VVFTTAAVAAAAHYALGLPWVVGFVLGAIVSPPDAVAPLSIIRRMKLPRRIAIILEGEGLANDATALILYRFAVAALAFGSFAWGEALGTFAAIVVGEILWGIAVGWAMLRLRRWAGEPRIEILLSVLTPFAAYLPPEMVGGSGVLATVCCGLYISWTGPQLISAATRLQGIFFWDFLIYMTEGLLFLITGLQARAVIGSIEGYSMQELLFAAAMVSAVVIVARFIWMYPATYLPRLVPSIRKADPSPPWTYPFALALAGIRGIVSLAAALAIPINTASGAPFPHRDLILFLTFAVIVVTLVGQGLLLPLVVRALGLANAGIEERRIERDEERDARQESIRVSTALVEQMEQEATFSGEVGAAIRGSLEHRLSRIVSREVAEANALREEIELRLLDAERKAVNDIFRAGKLKDEPRRRIERELDLREANIRSYGLED